MENLDRKKNVGPDQKPYNVASDLSLHCLPMILLVLKFGMQHLVLEYYYNYMFLSDDIGLTVTFYGKVDI